MPRGNGTGPSGFGSMPGRGAGFCAGFSVPGYINPVSERGFSGYGRRRGGGGRGWRNRFYATGQRFWDRGHVTNPAYGNVAPELTREAEMNLLKKQAEAMQKEVTVINERIKELETIASGQKD